MPVDVLILAAFFPELAPLQGLLGESLTGRVMGIAIEARVAGIGLPAAAAGAATQVAALQPRAVLLVGTCGAYTRAKLVLGEVVAARNLHLVDGSVLDGLSQFPEPMTIATDADPALGYALTTIGARPVGVATTLAITVDDAAADRIAASTGAHVEHLEAHGVALACASHGVPFAALLGVANFVGAGARAEWRAHHGAAEEAAAEHARRWLLAGAPGLP